MQQAIEQGTGKDPYKNAFEALATSKEMTVSKMHVELAYTIRVMLAHLRLKFMAWSKRDAALSDDPKYPGLEKCFLKFSKDAKEQAQQVSQQPC